MACQKVYKEGKVDSDGLPIHKASFMQLAMNLKIILSEWLHTNHAQKNLSQRVSSVGIDIHCIGACKLKCMHIFKWLCLILKGEIQNICLISVCIIKFRDWALHVCPHYYTLFVYFWHAIPVS